ncbi:hypothetical protein IHE45_09G010100 [Dioscorea alata]|uniref:Uncharacterized protein n=1 Tax=Dioscorea alata TaxID=55571 RepID=A0ACB7VDD2_DIOAL|nr:hypothetical protein IHE45_09G010100 [Dioscorea alata]
MGTSTGESSETAWAVPPPAAWYSPMPYVFGGLAAMLGLIVVAVLLLVCSYWKRFQHVGAVAGNTNLEAGVMRTISNGDDCKKIAANTISEERVLVIMAGDDKPSFLGVAFGSVIPLGEHHRLKKSLEME